MEAIADILDEQNRAEYALVLRQASIIVSTFSKVCLAKTHQLYTKAQ